MYYLFQNSFKKAIKTLKVYRASGYIWRTLCFDIWLGKIGEFVIPKYNSWILFWNIMRLSGHMPSQESFRYNLIFFHRLIWFRWCLLVPSNVKWYASGSFETMEIWQISQTFPSQNDENKSEWNWCKTLSTALCPECSATVMGFCPICKWELP